MTWTTHFTYLEQEPSLSISIGIGFLVGAFFGGGLYALFKGKGRISNPYILVIGPLIGILLTYVSYTKNIDSYNVVIDRIRSGDDVVTLEGGWSSMRSEINRYHAEVLLVGGSELTRLLRQQVYEGCLWEPVYVLMSNKKYQERELKISYVIFPEEGPKDYSDQDFKNMDLVCIFEVKGK